jgi:hypothetical protein
MAAHKSKIRPPIKKIINELKTWLPNYDHGPTDYPTILLRLLAALPGGEELEDAGYEPLGGSSIGWHEADQLSRVIGAIQDKQDVEDIARELLSDNEEELEEGPRGVREDSPPPFQPSARRPGVGHSRGAPMHSRHRRATPVRRRGR